MKNSLAYIELLTAFPPRPITAESELIATQETIDSLLDKGELTPDERDYLNVLGTLVYEYEQTESIVSDILREKIGRTVETASIQTMSASAV